MIATIGRNCPECGHKNPRGTPQCDLCGVLLVRPEAPPPEVPVVVRRSRWFSPEALKALGLGVLLAPVFTLAPVLKFMGWFFGSLCHETGHVAVAWAAGCPAWPAISLQGHAVAQHGEQMIVLTLMAWGALAGLAWRHRSYALAGAALFYPVFAFTGTRDVFFLLGGHLGELAFATIFLFRALVGGFSHNAAERVAYATMGFYLVGHNVWLSGGLLFSAEVQAWYRVSGSFGLTNDYLRLARTLGTDLDAIALGTLVLALAPLPLALLISRLRK